jgi:hypothetical protein
VASWTASSGEPHGGAGRTITAVGCSTSPLCLLRVPASRAGAIGSRNFGASEVRVIGPKRRPMRGCIASGSMLPAITRIARLGV